MFKSFDLVLWNYQLYRLLVLPVILGAIFGAGFFWWYLLHGAGGEWGGMAFILPITMACFYGLDRLTRRPARLVLTDKRLLVQYLAIREGVELPWAEVTTYKSVTLKGGAQLQIRLRSGQRVALSVSNMQGGYATLYHALKQAIEAYNTSHPTYYADAQPAAIVERKEFLATAVGRVLLAVAMVLPLVLMLFRCSK